MWPVLGFLSVVVPISNKNNVNERNSGKIELEDFKSSEPGCEGLERRSDP